MPVVPGEEPQRDAAESEFRASSKTFVVFAAETDFGPIELASNTFELEWPKGSGRVREFPEIDRVQWFSVAQARTKLLKGHRVILDRLMATLSDLRED